MTDPSGHAVDRGERGPRGDPGTTGAVGGEGPRGHAGDPALTRRRMQYLYGMLFVAVAVYGVLAQRQQAQVNANQHQIQMNAYRSCVALQAAADRLNRTFDQLAQIEHTNPYKQGNIGPRREAVYAAARFKPAGCGRRP